MINKTQIAIGLSALIVGVLLYLCDRPADEVYFLRYMGISEGIFPSAIHRLGAFGGSLPCFTHTFGFILITAGLIARTSRGYLAVSLSWLIVDGALELGQRFDDMAVALTPDWFAGIPFFENTKNYFIQGTYDGYDMLFILTGAVAGYAVVLLTGRKPEPAPA